MDETRVPEPDRSIADAVGRKAERKLRARRTGRRGVWFGLGMFGLVGWAVALPTVVGVALGLMAGFFRGPVDAVILRLIDTQLAFPVVLLVIALVAVVGPSLPNLIILMGLSAWPVMKTTGTR